VTAVCWFAGVTGFWIGLAVGYFALLLVVRHEERKRRR
jgi:tetrahydromethanopterin S-methyltransferase subunit B